MLDPDPTLRHGYTLTRLDELARTAVFRSYWRFISVQEQFDIARSAIAEGIYAAAEMPTPDHLVRLGVKAIRAHVSDLENTWGVYLTGHGGNLEPGTRKARFEKVWTSLAGPTPSHEDRIVDVTALRQIWPRLTPTHQAVLLALATYGDYDRAATALGKRYHNFVSHIHNARKEFLRLWHEGEAPSGMWGRDQRRLSGPRERSITALRIRRARQHQRRRTATGGGGQPGR
jgi:hypothetical protein